MKKIVITLIISVVFIGSVKSQDIYFGPKVGGNLSHIFSIGDDEDYKDGQMRLSSHFGMFAEIAFSEFLSLQPELLYSIKGDKFTNDADESNEFVYKYLSLPVVVKYYVTKEFTIEAGPQVAYLLSTKKLEISELVSSNTNDEEASIELKNDMEVYDVGATAGVGYLTKSGFYLSARYNLGLININKKDGIIPEEFKNGTIQLSAGFSFR